jgi:asparagine synthase (glutamine-hydrolysing)
MAICGIVIKREGRPVDNPTIQGMVSSLSLHDDWSCQQSAEVDFAFGVTSPTASTSLSVCDDVAVVCDADLYNVDELRARTTSIQDQDNLACLLGQLYRECGQKFLERLRGIFAIAVWNRRTKELLLATDRFSVKPIFYSDSGPDLVFASQPRGILASRRIEKSVNALALVNYLNFTVVPAPLSAFEGIAKLPPAMYLLCTESASRLNHYWDMRYSEEANDSTSQLATELLERMEEGVRVTSSDIDSSRLGCFLSGGTDSSSVVGLLTRLRKSPVTSLSIAFAEERFNEMEFAEIAAKHFGANLIVSRLGPQDAFQILPKIVDLYDEPFANSSVIPTYYCQRLARERGIDVMLAGDGGDELFGGNERYRTQQIYDLYQKVPRIIRHNLIEPVISHISTDGQGAGGKLRRYIQSSNTANPERYFQWSMLQHFAPEQVLGPALPSGNGHDPLAIARAHYQAAPANAEMNRLLYIDVKMTLGDNDLPKVMRAAELAGIKVRFPYLDHPLAEFSGRLPVNLKVRGLKKRYLFKEATRELLPRAILNKKKHGFGLPMGMWLKTDSKMHQLAGDVLHDPRTYQRGYFRREFIENTFAAMERDDTPFYGDVLWPFLMLELWHRRHIENATKL